MKFLLTLVVVSLIGTAQAQDSPKADDPDAKKRVRWSYGVRVKVSDLGGLGQSSRVRPALGLRWGRWSVGTVDADDFVGANLFQRQPSLAYRVVQEPELNISASLRLHNLSTGEGFDALSKGRHTIRARLVGSQKLDDRWSLVGETTADLLGRGDGLTATAGVGRVLHVSPTLLVGASAGVTFANATHWRTAYADHGPVAKSFGAGMGDMGLGLSVRGKVNTHWAWSAGLNTGVPLGQVRSHISTRATHSLQLGLQRFGG